MSKCNIQITNVLTDMLEFCGDLLQLWPIKFGRDQEKCHIIII